MRAALATLLASLFAVGCDIPTQLPRYHTTWDVVVVRDTIATADLLPDDVQVGAEGFLIDHFVADGEARLGEVCELCTCFEGPIPALDIGPYDWAIRLPGGVTRASLERGRARVVIRNEVGFDLLDDGQGGRGFLAIALTDDRDDRVLRQAFVTDPFPPGDSLEVAFDLSGLELSPNVVARLTGFMPGCGEAPDLTAESGFIIRFELEDVLATSVDVWVSDQALRLPERDLRLPGAIADRLRSGEARLQMEVGIETRLPAAVEIGMSAAGRREELFTGDAALYTPLLIPAGSPGSPEKVSKLYLMQLDPLHSADRIYLDTRNRFLELGRVSLLGGESVSYQVRLKAELPSW